MTKIVGQFYNLESSKASETVVSLVGDNTISITIAAANGEKRVEHFQADQLRISSRLGNTARYIDFTGFSRFETPDNDAVDALQKKLRGSSPSSFLHRLEANLPLIGVAMVVTTVFVWASISFGIPAISDKIVQALPARTADLIEEKFLEEIEDRWFKPSKLSEARQAEVQGLYNDVATKMGIDLDQRNYSFYLRDAQDSIGANALALPSGTIIMTDQLVNAAESDKQIAGVIAHELGHVLGQHSMKQIVRGSLLTFIVAFIAGDVAGASSTIVAAPVALVELRYSRDLEFEADQYAIDYFDCDTEGLRKMGRFFFELSESIADEKIAKTANDEGKSSDSKIEKKEYKEESFMDYLSTHPSNLERQQQFEKSIKERCKG